MAGKGGYQKPNNPAPVSGPGAMSKRTDGGPADPQPMRHIPTDEWGGSTEMNDVQQGAPMAGGVVRERPATRLDAPDDRPDVPVTSGANRGPGINSAEMLARSPQIANDFVPPVDEAAALIRAVYSVHPSTALNALMSQLEADGL